jgi:hypothetical protein
VMFVRKPSETVTGESPPDVADPEFAALDDEEEEQPAARRRALPAATAAKIRRI